MNYFHLVIQNLSIKNLFKGNFQHFNKIQGRLQVTQTQKIRISLIQNNNKLVFRLLNPQSMLAIKKTESKTVSDNPQSERNLNPNDPIEKNNMNMEVASEKVSSSKSYSYMDSSKWSNKQAVPASLKKSLIIKNNAIKQGADKKSPQIGFFQKIFHQCFAIQKRCQICGKESKNEQSLSIFNCVHELCQNCAEMYTLYKIKLLQEIVCPHQSCNSLIDKKCDFYKNLPENRKKEYQKIHEFYADRNQAQTRLCQKKGCEGIIDVDSGKALKCSKCKKLYCLKCPMVQHQGACEQNLINFYNKELFSSSEKLQWQNLGSNQKNKEKRDDIRLKKENPQIPQALEAVYQFIQQSPKVIVSPPIVDGKKPVAESIQKNNQQKVEHKGPILEGLIRNDANTTENQRHYSQQQPQECQECRKNCWNCLTFFIMEMIALPVQIIALLIILFCLIIGAIFLFPIRYICLFWQNGKRCIAITWIILYPITIIFAIGHSIGKGWGNTAIQVLNRVLIKPFNNCLAKCLGSCFKE